MPELLLEERGILVDFEMKTRSIEDSLLLSICSTVSEILLVTVSCYQVHCTVSSLSCHPKPTHLSQANIFRSKHLKKIKF